LLKFILVPSYFHDQFFDFKLVLCFEKAYFWSALSKFNALNNSKSLILKRIIQISKKAYLGF